MIGFKLRGILLIVLIIVVLIKGGVSNAIFLINSPMKGEKDQVEPVILWNQTYGSPANEVAYALVQTVDKGFALAGYTENDDTISSDMWLVKTDENGVEQWNQTYGKTEDEYASSLFQTDDEGFILAGSIGTAAVGISDMWLVKTDKNGAELWNRTYGGRADSRVSSLHQTTDGGFIFAGYTHSFRTDESDMWLVKTGSNGTLQWDHTYGGLMDEEASSLIQTVDGRIILVGFTRSYGRGRTDMWLVITDAIGTMQWNQTYGGTGFDVASALVQTSEGGFALAGSTTSYGRGGTDMWLLKIDINGNIQWNQTYGGKNYDGVSDLLQTSDGGFILAGLTESYGLGESDMWLVKTDNNGFMQWHQTFGGSGYEMVSDLIQTTDESFVLVGYTDSYGSGRNDICLVKISTKVLDTYDIQINVTAGLIILIILFFFILWSIRKNKPF